MTKAGGESEDTHDDLSQNLRRLAARYRSIAQLCQRMQINRQQFNKYLSGASRPSLFTLSRMADFFGVDERELLLPHAEFVRNVFSQTNDDMPAPVRAFFSGRREAHAANHNDLSRYVGGYFLYFRSPAWPRAIIKSLLVISQYQGATYARNVERLVRVDKPQLGCSVQKYCSLVRYEAGRIFMVDGNSRDNGGLAMLVLYPNSRNRIGFLHGLQLSLTSASGQQPYASRVTLEYLGKDPHLRQAIRSCGIYPAGSELIDSEIWQNTANVIGDDEASLTARLA